MPAALPGDPRPAARARCRHAVADPVGRHHGRGRADPGQQSRRLVPSACPVTPTTIPPLCLPEARGTPGRNHRAPPRQGSGAFASCAAERLPVQCRAVLKRALFGAALIFSLLIAGCARDATAAATSRAPTPTSTVTPRTPTRTPMPTMAPPAPTPTVVSASRPATTNPGYTSGCGSKGGPGYRLPSGKCASWRDATRSHSRSSSGSRRH